jgi:hypothetical protein
VPLLSEVACEGSGRTGEHYNALVGFGVHIPEGRSKIDLLTWDEVVDPIAQTGQVEALGVGHR